MHQKLVRFFKHPVVSNTQGKRLPPQKKKRSNGWMENPPWMTSMNGSYWKWWHVFPACHFFGVVFFHHNPSDKNANPTKLGERMRTFFWLKSSKWTLVGNIVEFDLLSLESFSNIFHPIVTGLHCSKLWEQLVPPADVNRTRFQQAIPRPPLHLRHLWFL